MFSIIKKKVLLYNNCIIIIIIKIITIIPVFEEVGAHYMKLMPICYIYFIFILYLI